jgi:hypothetical protein
LRIIPKLTPQFAAPNNLAFHAAAVRVCDAAAKLTAEPDGTPVFME